MRKTTTKLGIKLPLLAAVMVLVLGLSACFSSAGKTPASASELEGTWERTLTDGTETITLSINGSYKSDIRMLSGVTTHNSHTWNYLDGKLTVHYAELGVDSTYTVKIDGDQMTWDNGDAVITLTKKA